MNENPVRTFLMGSGVSLAGTIVMGLTNLLIRRRLSLGLPQADYGMFYSCIALLSMVFAWGNLGIAQSGTALIAEYAEKPERHECFVLVFILKLFFAVLLFAVIAVFAGPISRCYWGENCAWLLLLMGVYYVSEACFAAFRALLEGLKRFTTLRIFQVLLFLLILTGLVLNRHVTLRSAAATFVIGSLLISAAALFYGTATHAVKWTLPRSGLIREKMIRLISCLAISTMLFTSLAQMDTIMLTVMKGTESAAAYNIGLPIMQIVQSCLIFPAIFLPIAVQLCRSDEFPQLQGFVRWGVILTVAGSTAAFFFFRLTGKFWIRFLFDAKYEAISPLLPWLCAGIVFFAAGNFFVQLLIALGKLKPIVLIAAAVFFLNIVLNYSLIRMWGYIGAGKATFGSYLVFFALSLLAARYFICGSGGRRETK